MSDSPTTAIVWFRRDLRLDDNRALAAALAAADQVVPLFVDWKTPPVFVPARTVVPRVVKLLIPRAVSPEFVWTQVVPLSVDR